MTASPLPLVYRPRPPGERPCLCLEPATLQPAGGDTTSEQVALLQTAPRSTSLKQPALLGEAA